MCPSHITGPGAADVDKHVSPAQHPGHDNASYIKPRPAPSLPHIPPQTSDQTQDLAQLTWTCVALRYGDPHLLRSLLSNVTERIDDMDGFVAANLLHLLARFTGGPDVAEVTPFAEQVRLPAFLISIKET